MVTYGFYNSISHDRMYDATQFMNLFDGILIDGVFMAVGEHFEIRPRGDMTVSVGSGRAWFNGTWTFNDTKLIGRIPESELIYKRIDAVVLEVDKRRSVRRNRIFIKKGTPSNNPVRPTLVKDDTNQIYQYALGYITVNPEATEITGLDIVNVVGHEETPYATGLIQVHDVDAIWSQWEARFEEWFEKLRVILSGDVAGNLLAEIQRLDIRIVALEKWKPAIHMGTGLPPSTLGKNEDFYYKVV